MRNSQKHANAKDERIRRLLSAGTHILGGSSASAVSAALGLLVAGPAGAVVGGAAGAALSLAFNRLGNEISERLLSPREKARVGYVLAQAASDIRELIDQGGVLRTDGFFASNPGIRSDAEEIAESVLLKSQREAQEKKLPYMAHLLASLAFDSSISAEMAHHIIRTAEQMTYRQMCILKLATAKDRYSLRDNDYRGVDSFRKPLYSILYEWHDLLQRGYMSNGGSAVLGLTDIAPGNASVQGLGADLFNLMRLHRIPAADIAPIAKLLR